MCAYIYVCIHVHTCIHIIYNLLQLVLTFTCMAHIDKKNKNKQQQPKTKCLVNSTQSTQVRGCET